MSKRLLATGASPVRVRFKYQLGEWVLGHWCPELVPINADALDECAAEIAGRLTPQNLLPAVAGFHLRRARAECFSRGLSMQGSWLCYSPRMEKLYYVEIIGTFEDYLKRRSPKSRQNLKRTVKRYMERNPGALEIATEPDAMAAFQREAIAISRKTYQERLLGSGLPDTSAFLHAMKEKASNGEARGYLLRDQGQAIAFAWCAARGNTLVYEVIGYLPQHADQSPGTVLLYLILQDLFALERFSLLDFGSGHAFYKESFSTGFSAYADTYLLRASWGHRWRLYLHWLVERFSSWMGALLDRWGVKKRIRLAMRGMHAFVTREKLAK